MLFFFLLLLFSLQCPVLIAWGDKDPWEPIKLGRAYGNFESVEDFVVLPNVGHCPQVSLSLSFMRARTHTCRDYIFFLYNYIVALE